SSRKPAPRSSSSRTALTHEGMRGAEAAPLLAVRRPRSYSSSRYRRPPLLPVAVRGVVPLSWWVAPPYGRSQLRRRFLARFRTLQGRLFYLTTTVASPRARTTFSRLEHVLDLPNLIDIQKASFEWFKNEGLRETIDD